jgi:branched-chain amino acid transport system permease protein
MPNRVLVTSYKQDLGRFPDRWHKLGLVLWAAALVAILLGADGRWISVANLGCVAVVGSVGLMILTGFAGQVSLGHAAFLALGAYTVGVVGGRWHWPFWLALPMAGAVAASVGLLVGPFALRLRGLYLAIVTLGLVFLVDHVLISAESWTGGPSGLAVPMWTGLSSGGEPVAFGGPPTEWLGVRWTFDRKLFCVFAPLAVGAAWLGASLGRSNAGRAMMAVRDQDLAAAVLGVDPARSKILAFGISSFLAGVAGGMFGLQQQYLTVTPPFDLSMSIQYVAMIVLGGVGTTFGAVAGALAWVGLTPILEDVGAHLPLIASLPSHQRATVLFSAAVIVMLIVEPLGLFGIWLRIKRYFAAWPFRY